MSIEVLGIPLFDRSLAEAVETVVKTSSDSAGKQNWLISATGAHGLVFARKNKAFGGVLRSFHWNLPDGVPGVWMGRMKGAGAMERCYGPSFFEQVMRSSAGKPVRHFLCGGDAGVAELLKDVCAERFHNILCVGSYSPPFREMSEEELATLGQTIEALSVDIVWIGMSTPKQELFARRLSKHLQVHYIMTVGAAFDFHTGRVQQAPGWIQRLGLEWLFRLGMEPRRLYKRYLKIVPLFAYYGIQDILKNFAARR